MVLANIDLKVLSALFHSFLLGVRISTSQAPELTKSAPRHDHRIDQEDILKLILLCRFISQRQESLRLS